ncbi:type II secretion system minor pseudopilin GspI [Hyphomonas johnsonii]|uniref:Type II secretion system protein I n=1 Tax=Hyphomonas johnsonii MHS-2 TaxID=1280950 RepID=A0A059FV16_9PROT|nr:type II secretion system minor pseudopilin GspI [Hyphomonas johnsonii]KCZ94303.1 general secretion pathway protein I [Hyphomonas johnsonii MHS-2]
MPDHTQNSGFTLVEVLAALGVFSISAIGLIHLSTQTSIGARQVDMRALAEIEASNLMADALTAPPPLATGLMAGSADQRGRSFDWRRIASPTQEPGLILVDITVSSAESGQVLAHLQGLRTEP